ncbi:hypothetical protein MPRG_49170 [Mycobacterium paragordonae]|uniref:Transposase n=1 Tax=Mycobacterium paragordonae TaxID=1389713 RepID=A0ABQ1CB10_9MYCO|nr:hypothetical protein MPRG_49170 [Mycobacterium paragordonae]
MRWDGNPSGVPYIVSIGDMTTRLRTVMAPIRPGANRCGKLVTQDQGYRSASV